MAGQQSLVQKKFGAMAMAMGRWGDGVGWCWRLCWRRVWGWRPGVSVLPKLLENRVDVLERPIDVLSRTCSGENDLSRHKNEEHHLGVKHLEDSTREQLRLVAAVVTVLIGQTFEPDSELDVAGGYDVLDGKARERRVVAQLLQDTRKLSRRQLRIILTFCPRHHHLTRPKHKRCRLWFPDPHDHSSETLYGESVWVVGAWWDGGWLRVWEGGVWG